MWTLCALPQIHCTIDSMTKAPKIAIVCDFLTVMGGAETVVHALAEAFPGAPIYTAIYNKDKMPAFHQLDVRTSKLQKLPKKLRGYYKLFPTMAVKAMRKLDLSEFDIIIASTFLHGHQITKTRPDQTLIAYCHTPPRYYWSHYDEYRKDPGYGKLNPVIRALMPLMVPRQRKLDLQAVKNVDLFIANSSATAKRIEKYYGRKSIVVYPSVDTGRFSPARKRGDYYVTMGRQLPYKRYDLAVEACTRLNLPLKVFGNGPMHDKLVKTAGATVEFLTDRYGNASDAELEKAINSAKGFIYAAEEDFGIVTVEALAAGAPVIAYGRAGTLEIVDSEEVGVLFRHQTVEDVIGAIKRAEKLKFFPSKLQRTAKRFDRGLFITKIRKIVAGYVTKSS